MVLLGISFEGLRNLEAKRDTQFVLQWTHHYRIALCSVGVTSKYLPEWKIWLKDECCLEFEFKIHTTGPDVRIL
jgi:hypothetical protein